MKKQYHMTRPLKFINLLTFALLFIAFACSEKSKTKEPESQNAEEHEELFTIVEEMPDYPGGMDAFYTYVKNEITYPQEARQSGIEGSVFVQFVVDRDGSLLDVVAVKGIGGGCDDEAVKVVQSAESFTPGSQRGRRVRVRMGIPIIFKIDKEKKNEDNSYQGIIIVESAEIIKSELKVDATYSNGEWSGTVYDEEGDTLPGANIVVLGTTSGTVSDLDGTFNLKSLEEEEIVISFIGYETVKIVKNN